MSMKYHYLLWDGELENRMEVYYQLEHTRNLAYMKALNDPNHVLHDIVDTLYGGKYGTDVAFRREAHKISYEKLIDKTPEEFLEIVTCELYMKLLNRVSKDMEICRPAFVRLLKDNQHKMFGIKVDEPGLWHKEASVIKDNKKSGTVEEYIEEDYYPDDICDCDEDELEEPTPVEVNIKSESDIGVIVNVERDEYSNKILVNINARKITANPYDLADYNHTLNIKV